MYLLSDNAPVVNLLWIMAGKEHREADFLKRDKRMGGGGVEG